MERKKIHPPYTKFKGWMRENGITYSDIAVFLGVAPSTVCLKVNGSSDFLLSEIQLLKNKYNLDNNIFFTPFVA